MSLLCHWPAPETEALKNVDRIHILRSTTKTGRFTKIAETRARDYYGNWITHIEDDEPASTDERYYRAMFLENGKIKGLSIITKGDTLYQVTPAIVLETIQGLTAEQVNAAVVQRRIRWAKAWIEKYCNIRLEPTQLVEWHDMPVIDRIIGVEIGQPIQLNRWPIRSIDELAYRVHGADAGSQDGIFEDVDYRIDHGTTIVDGVAQNRGTFRAWVRHATINAFFSTISFTTSGRSSNNISAVITYTYGYDLDGWPLTIEEAVTKIAAADVMEIMGEASTAGLSSRSIDGYSESYTASATTTVFSARRIAYEKQIAEIRKFHRKPMFCA